MSYAREAEPMNVEVVNAADVDEMTMSVEYDEGAGPSNAFDDVDEGAGPSSAFDEDEGVTCECEARGVKRTGVNDDDGEGLKKKKGGDPKPFCNGQCGLCVTPRGNFFTPEGEVVDIEEGEADSSSWSFYTYKVCLRAGLHKERQVKMVVEKKVPTLRALSGATIERECKYIYYKYYIIIIISITLFFTITGEADEGVPVEDSDILKNLKQVYQPSWADHRVYDEVEDYMTREKDLRDARKYGSRTIKAVHAQLATLPR